MIQIATCSYGEFQPHMGVPVRTSVGSPKWFAYDAMAWENVYPKYHWLKLPFDDYRERYLRHLESVGVETLRGDITYMAETYAKLHDGDLPDQLTLLCFEKLSKPGAWCHRTLLSEWIQQNLSLDVVELGAKPEPRPEPEPGLW